MKEGRAAAYTSFTTSAGTCRRCAPLPPDLLCPRPRYSSFSRGRQRPLVLRGFIRPARSFELLQLNIRGHTFWLSSRTSVAVVWRMTRAGMLRELWLPAQFRSSQECLSLTALCCGKLASEVSCCSAKPQMQCFGGPWLLELLTRYRFGSPRLTPADARLCTLW